MALEYQLTWAGIPFITNAATVVRMDARPITGGSTPAPDDQEPPRKHQPEADLLDELDRLLPWQYLTEYAPPRSPMQNLDSIGDLNTILPQVKIGDWFYPTGASRWGVFRGLMTSSMVKEALRLTQARTSAPFVMKCNPLRPNHPDSDAASYTVTSPMFLLPPRPLGEVSGKFDGLFLVTLVDERWYFQGSPLTLRVNQSSTWVSLLNSAAVALGISLTLASAIEGAYSQPEPDSELWSNAESASYLLDALASNVGRAVVRPLAGLAGSYALLTPTESATVGLANRGAVKKVVRVAGGDLFDTVTTLPAGNRSSAKNAVVPAAVVVTFPKYVTGDDPVPHFANPRYTNQRPSAWFEDSFGDVYTITIPIALGGASVQGLTGVSTQTLQTTAKALYPTEDGVNGLNGTPTNAVLLLVLAVKLAQDYYANQAALALDERYPGTRKLIPEGLHDIVWTYSSRDRMAATRVMHAPWNLNYKSFQHATPGSTTTNLKGVGGKSVAQSWRDSYTQAASTQLKSPLLAGDLTASFKAIDNFPTQNRWRGTIGSESLLFEGTSGSTTVQIVYRGIDGTLAGAAASGAGVTQTVPDTGYGVNVVTSEKMQWLMPGQWRSGGIVEHVLIPQTQTVTCLCDTPASFAGVSHYSGRVNTYATNSATNFPNAELVWLVERNGETLVSGKRYDGQLGGWSASGAVAPAYLVNEAVTDGPFPALILTQTGPCVYAFTEAGPGLSGNLVARSGGKMGSANPTDCCSGITYGTGAIMFPSTNASGSPSFSFAYPCCCVVSGAPPAISGGSCCSGVALPTRLYATFTDAGNCPGLSGIIVPMDYVPGIGNWAGTTTGFPCSSGNAQGTGCDASFGCQDNGDQGFCWGLTLGDLCSFFDVPADCSGNYTCSPVMATFRYSGASPSNCCYSTSGHITVVVTQ